MLPSLPPPPCLCRWVCTECKYDHCNKCNKKLALEKLNEERQAQAQAQAQAQTQTQEEEATKGLAADPETPTKVEADLQSQD